MWITKKQLNKSINQTLYGYRDMIDTQHMNLSNEVKKLKKKIELLEAHFDAYVIEIEEPSKKYYKVVKSGEAQKILRKQNIKYASEMGHCFKCDYSAHMDVSALTHAKDCINNV